jgi:hypothetical protein
MYRSGIQISRSIFKLLLDSVQLYVESLNKNILRDSGPYSCVLEKNSRFLGCGDVNNCHIPEKTNPDNYLLYMGLEFRFTGP